MKYRTELYGGQGTRDACEVMAYEVFELGNSDIYDTLSVGILKGHHIMTEFEAYMREIRAYGYIDDLTWEDAVHFFKRILGAVEERTGKKVCYVLWLADRANAYRYLVANETLAEMSMTFNERDVPEGCDGIDAYDETGAVVLSELGDDGALCGFEVNPEPITI